MASFGNTVWEPEYSDQDNKEKVRLIGIEFEAKIKDLSKWPDDEFKFLNEKWLQTNKNEFYKETDDYLQYDIKKHKYVDEKLTENGIQIGGWGYDGGGKEFVTMPDSYTLFEQGGSERLQKLVAMLDKYTIADKDSGTHFHVSKLPGDTLKTWENIWWFCMCFGPQLQKLFGRVTGWAPVPLPPNYFQANKNYNEYLFQAPQKRPGAPKPLNSKHQMVNDRENRYEFRAPKASHNLEEILAWAELCNNIVNLCANGYIKDMPFQEILKGKHIRKYAHDLDKNPERALSSEERGKRISDIGYVYVNMTPTVFKGGKS